MSTQYIWSGRSESGWSNSSLTVIDGNPVLEVNEWRHKALHQLDRKSLSNLSGALNKYLEEK